MFTLRRTIGGMSYPIPVLFIPVTGIEYTIENVTLESSAASDSLELIGVEGTVKFISDEPAEYPFPLDGADFLTQKTGEILITITEVLPVGIHIAHFGSYSVIPGVCGMGIFGVMQAANESIFESLNQIVLQIQSFPDYTPVVSSEIVEHITVPTPVVTVLN